MHDVPLRRLLGVQAPEQRFLLHDMSQPSLGSPRRLVHLMSLDRLSMELPAPWQRRIMLVMSQSSLGSQVRVLQLVSLSRQALDVQARNIEQVLLVPPGTIEALRHKLLTLPLAEQIVEERIVPSPRHTGRRAPLHLVLLREMPPR